MTSSSRIGRERPRLDLDKAQAARLLDIMDQIDRRDRRRNARSETRWRRRATDGMIVAQHIDGGNIRLPCATRNISGGGISLLLRVFLHRGSKVLLAITDRTGSPCAFEGQVMHGRYVQDGWYEIGVRFPMRIDPAEFFHDTAEREAYDAAATPDETSDPNEAPESLREDVRALADGLAAGAAEGRLDVLGDSCAELIRLCGQSGHTTIVREACAVLERLESADEEASLEDTIAPVLQACLAIGARAA